MALFIDWCSFIGSWLLVAGPLYQAAFELQEHEARSIDIRQLGPAAQEPPPVSAWWFLPPLKMFLERRRNKKYHRAVFENLDSEQATLMVSFMAKATGWVFVATGAVLIAFKETFELLERMELSLMIFWAIIPVMFGACVLNTVARIRRGKLMTGGL